MQKAVVQTRCPLGISSWRSARYAGKLRTCCKARSTLQPFTQQEDKKQELIDTFGFKQGFVDDFDLGSMIGSGSFGVVHVAKHVKSNRQYAVKSIPKRFFGQHLEPHFVARVQHEVDVFRHMGQSLNVVHLIEAYEDDVCVDLVMELAAGGSLWSRIKRGSYTEATAAKIIADILRAVAQCHAKGVVLRDVKPENFLFLSNRENSPLKMVDFGLAEYCKPGQVLTERAGTPFYIAPEVLRQSYSFPADVWSAGVTAYQLLTGHFPWHADPDWCDAQAESSVETQFGSVAGSNKQLWRAIMYGKFDFEWPPWDTISVGARDLIQSMLTRDPLQRPTAAELLKHPWLSAAVTSLDDSDSSSSSSSSVPSTRPLDDSLVQRLQRYGTYGRLKQVALCEVARVMGADAVSLQGLAESFAALDPEGTGKIPYEAVRELLASGKYDLSEVEIRMLMSQFDLDHNGSVDYYEWLAALMDWTQAQGDSKWRTWIKQVFDAFDADGSGSISKSELLQLLAGVGSTELEGQEPYALADAVPAVLRRVDTDGDGRLSFEEFAALLQSSAADQLELFPSRRRRRHNLVVQRRAAK